MSDKVDSIADGCIVTFTGRIVDPLNPEPEMFCIEDIAHSLSNQCRFTGHTREFYSVAQHAVYVSRSCYAEDALAGLLHDASEAYLADLARPIKHAKGFGEEYREVEFILSRAIGEAFGVELEPLPLSVKLADDMLLRAEIRDLMPFSPVDDHRTHGPIVPWEPKKARELFLLRFDHLAYQRGELVGR